MQYPGVPFDSKVPSFPSRAEVLTYLQQFAEEHALLDKIHFNSKVTRIEPKQEANQRTLETVNNTVHTFDQIVVCNGHYTVPYHPTVQGLASNFRGQVLHSHNYRRPQPFYGKTVVVVGKGASGQDISLELMGVATRVYLVHADATATMAAESQDQRIHKPLIRCINSNGQIVFEDESTCQADTILFATG